MVLPPRRDGVEPTVGPETVRLAQTVRRLQAELAEQRRASRSRAVVDLATGMLAERLGLPPEQAREHLEHTALSSNTALAEFAAYVLGRRSPVEDGQGELPGPTTPRTGLAGTRRAPNGVASVRYRLAEAAMEAASSADELASALLAEGLGASGAAAVALFALEPDGALGLVGGAGLPSEELSHWRRVPPQMDAWLVRASRTRLPQWRRVDATRPEERPADALAPQLAGARAWASLPLLDGDHLLGVAEVVWTGPVDLDESTRRYVTAVVRVCAKVLRRCLESGSLTPPSVAGSGWFEAMLDGLLDPVMVISPIHEDGEVVDFRVEYANARIGPLAGVEAGALVGRRVLEVFPVSATVNGLLDAYVDVVFTGVPFQADRQILFEVSDTVLSSYTVTIRATRFLDGVLVCWRLHDDEVRAQSLLTHAERVGQLGGWEYDVASDSYTVTERFRAVMGYGPNEQLSGELLAEVAHPDDTAVAERFHRQVREEDRACQAELRIRHSDGRIRTVRVVAEPVLGPMGTLAKVRGVVQDVTERHRLELALEASRTGITGLG